MSAVTLLRISSLLLFMVFLQIVPNLFSQFGARAMKHDTDDERRGFHEDRDFFVVETLVITKDKHFTGRLSKARDGLANKRLQFAIGMQRFGTASVTRNLLLVRVVESDGFRAGTATQQIERSVDGGA